MASGAVLSLQDVEPMLMEDRKRLPMTGHWHYEIKYDGYRVLATTGDAPRLKSRNGANATRKARSAGPVTRRAERSALTNL